jgi:hypothetical protein
MTDPIPLIMSLTGCSEDEARFAYNEKCDTVDAIEYILDKIAPLPKTVEMSNPRKRKREDITPDEEALQRLRPTMEKMTREIEKSITSNQPAPSSEVATPVLHEETALQNSYLQVCQLPSVEEEVQTQETENHSWSECFCG